MKKTKDACVRQDCDLPRQANSDLCKKHTRKYYNRDASRYISLRHTGTGGGRKKAKLQGGGWYGSIHNPKKDSFSEEQD